MVDPQIVILVVAGSSPVGHPTFPHRFLVIHDQTHGRSHGRTHGQTHSRTGSPTLRQNPAASRIQSPRQVALSGRPIRSPRQSRFRRVWAWVGLGLGSVWARHLSADGQSVPHAHHAHPPGVAPGLTQPDPPLGDQLPAAITSAPSTRPSGCSRGSSRWRPRACRRTRATRRPSCAASGS